MFFQLGNIIFTGLLSPHTFNIEGDEATYAEHELINSKTRLQKTGDTLQEITFEIKFHAEFCNPTNQIAALKAACNAGTILPFLWGDGRYVNDYVIIKFPYTVDNAFADGTIIQATVTLTIREYISYNPMEQKQLAARKAAFAVGNKNPVPQRPPQPITKLKEVAKTITATNQQTSKIDRLVSDLKNNTAQVAVIGNKIKAAGQKANASIQQLNDQLDEARAIDSEFNMIRSSAGSVSSSVQSVIDLYPYTSISSLTAANTLLQGTVSSFGAVSSGLMSRVIERKPVN